MEIKRLRKVAKDVMVEKNKHLERQGTNDGEKKYKLKGNKLFLKNDLKREGKEDVFSRKNCKNGRSGEKKLEIGCST